MNERIKKACETRTEDGYHVFWPDAHGFFTAHDLREIAQYLDDLNADWDKRVRNYFQENH